MRASAARCNLSACYGRQLSCALRHVQVLSSKIARGRHRAGYYCLRRALAAWWIAVRDVRERRGRSTLARSHRSGVLVRSAMRCWRDAVAAAREHRAWKMAGAHRAQRLVVVRMWRQWRVWHAAAHRRTVAGVALATQVVEGRKVGRPLCVASLVEHATANVLSDHRRADKYIPLVNCLCFCISCLVTGWLPSGMGLVCAEPSDTCRQSHSGNHIQEPRRGDGCAGSMDRSPAAGAREGGRGRVGCFSAQGECGLPVIVFCACGKTHGMRLNHLSHDGPSRTDVYVCPRLDSSRNV